MNYRALLLAGTGVGLIALLWPRDSVAPGTRRSPSRLSTSAAGIDFILEEEGFSATPYKDDDASTPGRVEYAIGHGHQILPGENLTRVSRDQARAIFQKDLARFEDMVRTNAQVDLTQNEFDALVAWSYNVGNRPKSTLYRKLNAGDYGGAADEFAVWRMAGGRVHPVLAARRAKEAALFRT